ncbi:Clavaminate synthase-like protein [Fistulina hepatica ATCC 64428]|uniref:Clavaminate synthase-like protein n=1 Tax=Fistulina hepatica ATCC 64428 TaxID=1128425 RepID=A0A0D7A770_9AGAR|nr:Clavaminate synthase-like protein [Fistulina hepatica ATCC 64428]
MLPVIDVAPLLGDSPTELRAKTCAVLHSACLEYGFFYLNISAFVDASEPEGLAALAHQFFDLPQDEKEKIALRNQDGARGYARLKENVTMGKADNHEGIDFYRPVENPDKTRPLWGENQWPAVPGFRQKYGIWVEKMKRLGMIVMRGMADGLGMTADEWEDLRKQIDDSFWVMRLIFFLLVGYPPLPADHDGVSCGAHRDYGCLTFLWTDPTRDALQVFMSGASPAESDTSGLPQEQGGEQGVWITANPIPGCVVCNIGEMWDIWTNGLYRATLHQVVHRSNNYRIPFFFEPNFDAHVRPLDAALRIQKKPPEKKPVIYGEFLMAKVGGNFDFKKGEGGGRY